MIGLRLAGVAGFAFIVLLSGCGGQKAAEDNTSSSASAPAATAGGAVPAVSPFDQGPRAAESPVDEAAAKRGEGLFQTKACSACHAFGKRVSCPDLAGVSARRTHAWLEAQILHPEKMTKEDPIARQLFAQFSLQMPNQGLTQIEALAVIEFFKHKDHEAGESHESKEAGK